MKIRSCFALLSILLISCVSDKTVPDPQELLRKELHTIDWKKVDEYPTIDSCDSIKGKEENKICFFTSITNELKSKIAQDTLITQIKGLKKMNILVTITKDDQIFFQSHPADSIRYNVTYLNTLLANKHEEFTKVHPALKRGLPVTTKFILPIRLP